MRTSWDKYTYIKWYIETQILGYLYACLVVRVRVRVYCENMDLMRCTHFHPVRFVSSAEAGGLPRSKVRRYCACQPAYRPLDLTTCKLQPTLHWSRRAAASSWCNRICFLVACGGTVLTGCGKHQLFLLLFHEVTLGVVSLLWVLSAAISW